MRILKIVLVNILIFFLLVESASFIWVSVLKEGPPPLRNISGLTNTPLWVDIDPVFGVWHLPNTHNLQIIPEMKSAYYFNSAGARDFERSLRCSDPRILLLGDSFAEGFGVDTLYRFSNILERNLAIPVLNFGTSGNFGSTGERMLYESLASDYDHKVVVMCIFPQNDFNDDDIEFGKLHFYNRYRPYLVPEMDSAGTFELQYYLPGIEQSDWHPSNIGPGYKAGFLLRTIFKTQTYTGSLIAMRRRIGRWRGSQKSFNTDEEVYSSYNNFSDKKFSVLAENIENIAGNCTSRKRSLVLVVIPAKTDVQAFRLNPERRLTKRLSKLTESNSGIHILDLLPCFSEVKNYENLYYKYDGHWNKHGHALAAKVLTDFLKRKFRT